MSECIALIRGINVGRNKRLAMADLRDLMVDLGHTNVRTLLNSGNVLFQSKRPNVAKIAASIETAINSACGFTDHARHLVAFVTHPKHLEPLRPMLKESWKPDALAVTERAAYLWCATGILDSKFLQAFSRRAGATVTTRNWATVLKLQAAAKAT
jgi:uncharacterized protein (DUF1697 family)